MGVLSAITGIVVFLFIIENNIKKTWPGLAIWAVIILVMIGTGSRAEIFGYTLATMMILVSRYRGNLRLVTAGLILVMGIGMVTFMSDYLPEVSRNRLIEFFYRDNNYAAIIGETMRPSLWNAALTSIPKHPLGIGWGGFEKVWMGTFSTTVERIFPHNLILESLAEGGWAVGLWLTAIIFLGIRHLWRMTKPPHEIEHSMLFCQLIILLVSVLVSGEWNDSRIFFGILSLSLIDRRIFGRQDRPLPNHHSG
jgi:O-antigen ligase